MQNFLLGIIVTASFVSALYFLKFWHKTRDQLFLAFALAFAIEGANRIGFLFLERPNEGSALIYMVRMLAFLIILMAILHKNSKPRK
jgi:hypothetical protein